VVPNESWLIRNHLLCSYGQNRESPEIELKNVGPTSRIVYKGTTIAKIEKETASSQVFSVRQSSDERVNLEDT